jgi:Repeat of unknown function (DUF5650)/Dockerin type I domain
VGAVTLINGMTGKTGPLIATGSIVGPKEGDSIGDDTTIHGVHALPNSNFVVLSSSYDNGTVPDTAAISFGNGTMAQSVVVEPANSVIGRVGEFVLWIDATDNVNQTFFASLLGEGRIIVGSQIDGFAHHWHLAVKPLDVNNDTHLAANDAVAIINYINAEFPSAVGAGAKIGQPYGFLDVNGDDFVAANDVLDVINAINAGQGGEGESAEGRMQHAEGGMNATALAEDSEALMMLLAVDLNGQAGRRRGT